MSKKMVVVVSSENTSIQYVFDAAVVTVAEMQFLSDYCKSGGSVANVVDYKKES